MIEYDLAGQDFIELNKLLKLTDLVNSGGEAKLVIREGLVMVNEEPESRLRRKLRSGDLVSFEGQEVLVK
jgi:ribosome-associated protein